MKRMSIIGVAFVASIGIAFQSYYSLQASPAESTLIETRQQVDNEPITVVFDLGNVLIATNKRAALWHLGPRNVFSYLIRNRSIGLMKKQFYAALNRIDGSDSNPYGAKDPDGHMLPNLMATWLQGKQPNAQLLEKVVHEIENHPEWFSTKQEQHIITAMANFTFNPNNLINACRPINEMVSFARQCKEKNHRLYVLSNWDPESFELLAKKYPELFKLFDGVVISGQVHKMKPDPDIFSLITQKVPAHTCIFIDDQQENIDAAQKAGMHTILAAPKRALISKAPDMQKLQAKFKQLEKLCSCTAPTN